jgi:hypothetical protein
MNKAIQTAGDAAAEPFANDYHHAVREVAERAATEDMIVQQLAEAAEAARVAEEAVYSADGADWYAVDGAAVDLREQLLSRARHVGREAAADLLASTVAVECSECGAVTLVDPDADDGVTGDPCWHCERRAERSQNGGETA